MIIIITTILAIVKVENIAKYIMEKVYANVIMILMLVVIFIKYCIISISWEFNENYYMAEPYNIWLVLVEALHCIHVSLKYLSTKTGKKIMKNNRFVLFLYRFLCNTNIVWEQTTSLILCIRLFFRCMLKANAKSFNEFCFLNDVHITCSLYTISSPCRYQHLL